MEQRRPAGALLLVAPARRPSAAKAVGGRLYCDCLQVPRRIRTGSMGLRPVPRRAGVRTGRRPMLPSHCTISGTSKANATVRALKSMCARRHGHRLPVRRRKYPSTRPNVTSGRMSCGWA